MKAKLKQDFHDLRHQPQLRTKNSMSEHKINFVLSIESSIRTMLQNKCKFEPIRILEMQQFLWMDGLEIAIYQTGPLQRRLIPKNTNEAIALAEPSPKNPRGHDQNARSETRTGADNHYLNISRNLEFNR